MSGPQIRLCPSLVVFFNSLVALLKKSEWTIFFFFFSRKCWESVRFAAAENWFEPPKFFNDRTKAIIQHFLEKSFK